MKIAYFGPENWLLELMGALNYLGHQVMVNKANDSCDVVMNWSVSSLDATMQAYKGAMREKPLIVYNWDVYSWQFEGPRAKDYNWTKYAVLLSQAKEIWVPSSCTKDAQLKYYKQPRAEVVKTFTPLHHMQGLRVKDNGFVFHAMRDYPVPELMMLQQACSELNIPCIRSKNEMSLAEYRKTISQCSFIVSYYNEASTGGLAIQEAAYLGKPVLLNDSHYNGGSEYMGDRATYFKRNDYDDFKENLKKMWDERPVCDKFTPISVTDMALEVDRRIRYLCN
jgi:hypothetical protein